MRDIIISVAASILTASVCFWGFQFSQEDGGLYASASEAGKLSVVVAANTKAITALQLEITAIRDLLNMKNVSLNNSVATAARYDESDNLIERIQALEDVLEELSLSNYGSINKTENSSQGRIIHRLSEPTETSALQQNSMAESAFENDSGVPLNDYAASLEGTLHAIDSIDVKGMDCRDTICKITYSNSESLTPQEESDGEEELIEKLMDGAQGRDLDIRYAKDTQGNNVMYVQLQ